MAVLRVDGSTRGAQAFSGGLLGWCHMQPAVCHAAALCAVASLNSCVAPSAPPPLQHFCLYPAHAEGQFWPEPSQQGQQGQQPGQLSGPKKGALAGARSSARSSASSSRGPATPSPSAAALAAPAAHVAALPSEADLEAARHGIEPAGEQEQAPLLRR